MKYLLCLTFFLCINCVSAEQSATNPAYLALVTVVKDSPEIVREWVDYHLGVGFQKIYVFETDNPLSAVPVLKDLIDQGKVECWPLPRVNPRTIPIMQVRIYSIAIKHLRERHTWVGFWDVDEFLTITNPAQIGDLREYLTGFEQYGGVVINWRLMGSNGHKSKPKAGVIEAYTSCTPNTFPDNALVKTLVHMPNVWVPTTDPHHFAYREGKFAVTTAGVECDGPSTLEINHSSLMLLHFGIKSEEDYRIKMSKGTGMGNYKGWSFFKHVDDASTEQCTHALDVCRRTPSMGRWCPAVIKAD